MFYKLLVVFQFLIYHNIYANNIIFPISDPIYLSVRQNFLHFHDLSIYKEHSSLTNQYLIKHIDNFVYHHSIDKQNVFFQLLPKTKLWKNKPQSEIRIWASAYWDNLSIIVEPVIVTNPYGPSILGTNDTRIFSSSGVSGRLTHSLVRYQNDILSFQLGRSPVWWGQPWGKSIIQSSTTPSYDHLDMRFNFNNFQLEVLAGQLGSEKSDEGERISRNIAGHRLTWTSDDNKWLIGVGEQVLYTGVNRSMEWWYLNPAVPYFFTALEEDEEILDGERDNDNSILFIFGRYVFKPNISPYFELIVDEFQTKERSKDIYPNSLGIKIGIDGLYTILSKDIYFNIEYNKLDNWTYIHGGQFTNWQNRDHSIGYPYGSDLWSSNLQLETWVSKRILLSFDWLYLKKGNNNLSTYWEAEGSTEMNFPSKPESNYNLIDLSTSFYHTVGFIKMGLSNKTFPNDIAFDNNTNYDQDIILYLEIQLIKGIGVNI